ncbi:MAG: hypothetical protein GXP29_11775 [Planctomycetes bacterium]|nr:hypothetical protein [Planctomycetota bacterium]
MTDHMKCSFASEVSKATMGKEKTMRMVIDYIHRNPIRRKLVDQPSEWKWSSWHAYEGEMSNAPPQSNVNVWS